MPEPIQLPVMDYRQAFNLVTDTWTKVKTNGEPDDYRNTKNRVYSKLGRIYRCNIVSQHNNRRKINKKIRKLDIVEEMGLLEALYSLALEMYGEVLD